MLVQFPTTKKLFGELFSCANFGQPRVVYVEKDMLNLAERYFRQAHELSGEFLYHVPQ